ncbi:DNA polymerase III subunit epsilon [Ferrimonas sediminicola]|uniref:DNA polymerase III subunit epsilon n=1 Tax=Ferrimonas sediminicola TaxID=2569538 RepID=A0A4V5NY09_9GAMM|nr:DNA polymerase III subunit epsilon [Ferrimonas sediminicola]TKB48403.1 DNA polymerase III subunit epsilon [Ferrimonas sediminicola]
MTEINTPVRQIVFDTETTGMNQDGGPHYEGHRLIEIGCVEMVNRKLTGRTYHVYIKPDRPVDEEAIQVHGITDAFLADKPMFHEVVDEFMEFVRGAELIAHNAQFDIGFIDYEFQMLGRYGKLQDHCSVVDTLQLAREKKSKGEIQGNLNLDALCRFYGIDNSHRTLHGALLDSEILADVYLFMTGGQKALELASGADGEGGGIVRLKSDRAPLKVIGCTADDISRHEKRLELVSEPIWLRG